MWGLDVASKLCPIIVPRPENVPSLGKRVLADVIKDLEIRHSESSGSPESNDSIFVRD